MKRITGEVVGVDHLYFRPSIGRFRTDEGVVLRTTVGVAPDPDGSFTIDLPDNSTLQGYWGESWQWICTEQSGSHSIRFAFSSGPGDLNYADIRPLGVTL